MSTPDFGDIDNPQAIAAIEKAYAAVWLVICAHNPPGDEPDQEIAITLSRTLVALAAAGIVDPEELRSRALQTYATQVAVARDLNEAWLGAGSYRAGKTNAITHWQLPLMTKGPGRLGAGPVGSRDTHEAGLARATKE